MRILAIETSTSNGSVALIEDGLVVAERDLPSDQKTATSLLPAIDQLFAGSQWPRTSMGLVAVTTGPGSFTGLRIGVVTAKSIAYATGSPICGMNTADVIASQARALSPPPASVLVLFDAQRGQLLARLYGLSPDAHLSGDQTPQAAAQDVGYRSQLTDAAGVILDKEQLGSLLRDHPDYLIGGPGIGILHHDLLAGSTVMDEHIRWPHAGAVGQLAAKTHPEDWGDAFSVLPRYHRRSAAEEKRQRQLENHTYDKETADESRTE